MELSPVMQFRLKFNKPAFSHFFRGLETGGIEIELSAAKEVRFRPVKQEYGENIIAVTEDVRGGVKTAMIEGERSAELFKRLVHPLGYSFYELERAADGWVVITPWYGPSQKPKNDNLKIEPNRLHPIMRLWLTGESRTATETALFDEISQADAPDDAAIVVRDKLRRICDTLVGLDELPLGAVLPHVMQAQALISEVMAPLEASARVEAISNLKKGSSSAIYQAPDAPPRPRRGRPPKTAGLPPIAQTTPTVTRAPIVGTAPFTPSSPRTSAARGAASKTGRILSPRRLRRFGVKA